MVSQLPHQVEGFAHRLLQRHPERVAVDVGLDGRLHLWGCAKKTVGWDESLDALMGPLEVVAVDEELEASQQVRVVGEHRA